MTKIVTNPKIMLGKATIAGTRITVEQILQLKEVDVKTAVKYCA